jgi:metal transporter CNNM
MLYCISYMDILLLVITIIVLISLSAVCSGLNISFMSLDMSDLRRKAKLGNAAAKALVPFRKNSHLTLAAILLTNVAMASATPLVIDSRLNGIVAVAISTLLLVVLGEIVPQALFSRHAIGITYRLLPFIKVMIFITYPISKPLQLLLDKLFGKERAQLHNRDELGVILAEHHRDSSSELDEDEIEIMQGAISLSEKRTRDITTEIGHVYWVTPSTVIDATKITEIKANGWSRIPVFNLQLTTCYGVLLMKDLVDMNFDVDPPRVDDLLLHPTQIVGSMTALDTLFRKFINAGSHLIPVERDDKIIGIVTIEDLLEEIVGHEIEDESDRSRRTFRLRLRRPLKKKTKL